MKTLSNGMQCEILKVFRGQSNNYKANTKDYADLIRIITNYKIFRKKELKNK